MHLNANSFDVYLVRHVDMPPAGLSFQTIDAVPLG